MKKEKEKVRVILRNYKIVKTKMVSFLRNGEGREGEGEDSAANEPVFLVKIVQTF